MPEPKPCVACGTTYWPLTTRSRTCTPACARRLKADLERVRYHRDPVAGAARVRAHRQANPLTVTCTGCGKSYQSIYGGVSYCTNACQAAHQYPLSDVHLHCSRTQRRRRSPEQRAIIERERMVKAAQRAAVRTDRARPRWAQGTCHRCGATYIALTYLGGRSPSYCSDVCKQRDSRARRRALEAGADIAPGRRHHIFERDNWTCGICGDPVDRTATVPDLAAPTIDHIVPLALGGAHAPANWQTAHFYCNSVKGASHLCLTG